MARSYYDILELPRDANQEDVKRAYRRLARQSHPDANPEDPHAEERFKELNTAYQVLSDPARRREYDLFGRTGRQSHQTGGADGIFEDIFDSFFGGGSPFGRTSGGRTSRRGRDLLIEVEIGLEDVVFGTTKDIHYIRRAPCGECGGNGARPGTAATRCAQCSGSGEIRSVSRSFLGNILTSAMCPACGGSGEQIAAPCNICRGGGSVEREEQLDVEIPAGVQDGMRLRISGRADVGTKGSSPGDLYVGIRVARHSFFERRSDDLWCRVEVPMTSAALGTTVEIDTADGPQKIDIPAGFQSGKIIRVRGKGVGRLGRGTRGDLLAELHVQTPDNLNEEQRALLQKLAGLRDEKFEESGGFVDKIRSAFK